MAKADHEEMMRDAIEVASEAAERGEAPIGAVLFNPDGERIAQGWNQRRSTGNEINHAELVAFAAAAQPGKPQPEGLVLVSTLEPCVMCWGACLNLKCSSIVYGLEAPLDGGRQRVNDPDRHCDVVGEILRQECRALFVKWISDNPSAAGSDYVRQLLDATA